MSIPSTMTNETSTNQSFDLSPFFLFSFLFLCAMPHYRAQAGLELLILRHQSRELLILLSAGITAVHHCACLHLILFWAGVF